MDESERKDQSLTAHGDDDDDESECKDQHMVMMRVSVRAVEACWRGLCFDTGTMVVLLKLVGAD